MLRHYDIVANTSCPSCKPPGAYVLSLWIPFDIWPRIASHLISLYDIQSFRNVCRAADHAVALLRAPRVQKVCDTFHVARFEIPPNLEGQILMVHAVPPHADSVILFLDSESGPGIDLAWLRGNYLKRVSLGLQTVPASSVSNIRFSPDGKRIAFLVTLAHGALVQEHFDPLHRLRGWDAVRVTDGRVYDVSYDPCEDCTIQIVDLEADEKGMPSEILIHTFSHVFVPEYGFDMVWRSPDSSSLELAFAAMLHSSAGAATYLVRWRTFHRPTLSNYVFMACIDGASAELLYDKRYAMLTFDSTRCTSRIEISREAKYIYFDTLSKVGILRFDQVEDANNSRVTRADLPNFPALEKRRSLSSSPVGKQDEKLEREGSRLRVGRPLQELNVGNPAGSRSPVRQSESVTRVSRMSPDGTLLCSVLLVNLSSRPKGSRMRHVEMRSSISGKLLYRRRIPTLVSRISPVGNTKIPLDKSGDVAQHTLTFSDDSELVVLWDTQVAASEVAVDKGLPVVIQAHSGLIVQDFHDLRLRRCYEHLQMAPDGQALYGTRLLHEEVLVDAIDVLSGAVLKTVCVGAVFESPEQLSGQSSHVIRDNMLLMVSRGWVDALWEATRGSLGCGWTTAPQSQIGDDDSADHGTASPCRPRSQEH